MRRPSADSHLAVNGRIISVTVALSGGAGGCDTPQLYLSAPTAATDPSLPLKTLKNFTKVCNATQDVSFTVSDADVSVWDTAAHAWSIVNGVWGVSVGASSADVRLTGQITI